MTIEALRFTDKELKLYMDGVSNTRQAIEALVLRAEREAERFVDAAQTDRESAVSQGMLRIAMQLRETIQGAPDRLRELASRKTGDGNSPNLEGFV